MLTGTHRFADVVALAEWLAGEGLLDEAWVDAVHPEEPRLELLWQLQGDPPQGTKKGDHRWWSERTTDDVLPWTLTVDGSLTGDGLGRIVGYHYDPDRSAPEGLRLELEGGSSLRIRGTDWRVAVHSVRRGVPRLG